MRGDPSGIGLSISTPAGFSGLEIRSVSDFFLLHRFAPFGLARLTFAISSKRGHVDKRRIQRRIDLKSMMPGKFWAVLSSRFATQRAFSSFFEAQSTRWRSR